MTWLRAVCIATLAACGTTPDDRPATLEVVTLEVLAPACGTVACHSTTTNEQGYAFDTLAAARETLPRIVTAGQPDGSELYDVLVGRRTRMPPDAPLADEDIALVRAWIAAGAQGL